MSQARAMRRKLKRAMVNTNISAEKTDKIIESYIDLPNHKQEMYNNALGDMILLFAGYQRVCEKRGKKKISEAVESFVAYCNEMSHNHTKRNAIAKMLEQETGYRFFDHAGELELVIKEEAEEEVS